MPSRNHTKTGGAGSRSVTRARSGSRSPGTSGSGLPGGDLVFIDEAQKRDRNEGYFARLDNPDREDG